MADRLYRSRDDTVIGGVAGGVAEALDVDPSIVRVVWVVLAILTGGVAALVYLIMLIVVPQAPESGEVPAEGAAAAVATATGSEPATGSESVTGTRPAGTGTRRARARRSGAGGGLVFGAILILVGAYFLVREYVPDLDLDLVWPVAVIVLGGLLVLTSMRSGSRPS
jgi:phage shock protein PspC (stress-responsive transcriptional regulator)